MLIEDFMLGKFTRVDEWYTKVPEDFVKNAKKDFLLNGSIVFIDQDSLSGTLSNLQVIVEKQSYDDATEWYEVIIGYKGNIIAWSGTPHNDYASVLQMLGTLGVLDCKLAHIVKVL